MSVKPKTLLSTRRLLTENDLHGLYEALDDAHQNGISYLDEAEHLELIDQYEAAIKTLDPMITAYRENRQYSQACIFSTLIRTLSHRIVNHYEALTFNEQPVVETPDLGLGVDN